MKYISREKSASLLSGWRTKMSISREAAAEKLEIAVSDYESFEDGLEDIPLQLWVKCRMIEKTPFSTIFFDVPRERWVTVVDLATRFVKGENVVGRMISQGMWQELRDFMDLARLGPNPDLALTDPHLFMTLREAGTKAYLSGLMHFKGPVEPFERYKLPRQRTSDSNPNSTPKI